MAGKRKKTTTVVEEIPPELEPTEEANGPTDLDFALEEVQNKEKLEEVIEQFPDAGIVAKLYDDSGAFCYRFADPRNIDEEDIRKRCGPGNYNVRIYLNGKYRQSIKLPIRQLLVADPLKPSDGFSTNHHSEFLEKLLLAFISKEATPQPSMALPSLADLTTALSNLDSLRAKPESALDMVLKGINLAKDLNGETDWKTDLIRLGRDTLPKIVDTVASISGGHPMGGQKPNEISTQPEATVPPAEAIKAGISYLKKKCIAGIDPELIVAWVVNNAEDYEGFIKVILNMDFAEFAKYDLEIGAEPFIGWFRAVFDGCRSAFSGSDSVDADTPGTVGNIDNVGSNGKPSTNGKPEPKG